MVFLNEDVVFSFEICQLMLLIVVNVENDESSVESLLNPLSIALEIATAFDIDVGMQIQFIWVFFLYLVSDHRFFEFANC